ncbi:shikimate 5-dehydrogenase [Anopheles sinensis]|uniref:Shikimate 5-dehydrogenase n=1 Tax=Anopheles sinensis TaxID=74873 RepID=A0A084W523_ANOSI|nr:shikimate 5-dehydrogenase [Anopheles sinensis]
MIELLPGLANIVRRSVKRRSVSRTVAHKQVRDSTALSTLVRARDRSSPVDQSKAFPAEASHQESTEFAVYIGIAPLGSHQRIGRAQGEESVCARCMLDLPTSRSVTVRGRWESHEQRGSSALAFFAFRSTETKPPHSG